MNPAALKHLLPDAFRTAAIGMALVSFEGRYLHVNGAMSDFFGYSAEELFRLTFQELTHPDDLERDRSVIARHSQKEIEVFRAEKRYHHKEGHIIWAQVTSSIVRNAEGQPLCYFAQLQDITQQKAAEQNLARTLADLERMVAELKASQSEAESLRAGLVTVCAWTKKVQHEGQWIPVDQFLSRHLKLNLSHGISEEAADKLLQEQDEAIRTGRSD